LSHQTTKDAPQLNKLLVSQVELELDPRDTPNTPESTNPGPAVSEDVLVILILALAWG